jgi:hypothetical protein
VLTFCADFNRFVKWCEASDAVPGYDNFQSFISAMLDTTIVAQQFCTIAEMQGLGCCYLGTTTWNAAQIAEALHLPTRVIPIVTITVGYPAEEAPMSDRLPVAAIMHNEYYSDYTTDDIEQYYKPKETLSENLQFVLDNGKHSLAQVFTDIRYPKEANEHFSDLFFDFLSKQGYFNEKQ